MDKRYKYLCAVEAGDSLHAAIIPNCDVKPDDLVILDTGVQGYVTHVVFVDTEGDEYKLFCEFNAVDTIVDVYSHTWHKPEESEDE